MLKVLSPEDNKFTRSTSSYSEVVVQEVLGNGFCIRVKGRGMSMYPMIRTGDILLVEPEKPDGFSAGDIIFFKPISGIYVVHRLMKKDGSATLITKGDNLNYYDAAISVKQVLGRVVRIDSRGKCLSLKGKSCRMFGWLLAWLSNLSHSHSQIQTRLMRNLGRLCWITGGRRTA
jgi:signal peptidase I